MKEVNLRELIDSNGISYELKKGASRWDLQFTENNPTRFRDNAGELIVLNQRTIGDLELRSQSVAVVFSGINFESSRLKICELEFEHVLIIDECKFRNGVSIDSNQIESASFNTCEFNCKWLEGEYQFDVILNNCIIENLKDSETFIGRQKVVINGSEFFDSFIDLECGELFFNNVNKIVYSNFSPRFIGRLDVSHDIDFFESTITIGPWIENCTQGYSVFSSANKITDPWHKLRDTYTGFNLYMVTFFTATFFLPYIVKTASYLAAARTFEGKLSPESYSPLWRVLFPVSLDPLVLGYTLFGVLMIAYNAARFKLTHTVNSFREREEHLMKMGAKHSRPPSNELSKMLKWHTRLKYIWWAATISVVMRIFRTLFVEVPDPQKFFG